MVTSTHGAIVTHLPLPAFCSNKQRRKGKQLERLVLQPVPLLMQPFSILAGTVIDDVVYEGREQMEVIDRQSHRRLAVRQREDYTHGWVMVILYSGGFQAGNIHPSRIQLAPAILNSARGQPREHSFLHSLLLPPVFKSGFPDKKQEGN